MLDKCYCFHRTLQLQLPKEETESSLHGEEQAKLFCIIVAVSVMWIIVSQVIDFQKFMSTLKKVMTLLYIYVLT